MYSALEEAYKWFRGRPSASSRVSSFLLRCIEDNFKPKTINLSSDLYREMLKTASSILKKSYDKESPPTTLHISLGDHTFELVHHPEFSPGTIQTTK